MKEINTKPDVRETGAMQGRTELPRERFDPNKPSDNISKVIPQGNDYKIYDARSTIPIETLRKERFGDYKFHGKDFILFEKTSPSGLTTYKVCDSKGKILKEMNSPNVGKFVGQSGENMTFEKANMYYTFNKNFQQVGNPVLKPRT